MERPWIKIIDANTGKTLIRCKKLFPAASCIVWAHDQAIDTKLLIVIDGHDYGACRFPSNWARLTWETEAGLVCEHIQDCLNIHKAFYEKSLDLHEERE